MILGIGTEHVIVGKEVRRAEPLDDLGLITNRVRSLPNSVSGNVTPILNGTMQLPIGVDT